MQVKCIAECSNAAILLTFIKLPFVIKIFVLSIFEGPFYTGFTETLSKVSVLMDSKYSTIKELHYTCSARNFRTITVVN